MSATATEEWRQCEPTGGRGGRGGAEQVEAWRRVSDESWKRQWEVVAAALRAPEKEEEEEEQRVRGSAGLTSKPLRPPPHAALAPGRPHPRLTPAARGPSSCPGDLVSWPLGVQPSPCFLTRPLPKPGLPRGPSLQALPCTLSVPGDSLPSLDPRPFPYTRCIPRPLSASRNFLPDPPCLSGALPRPQALAAFLRASLGPQDLLCSSVSPSRVWALVPLRSSQDPPWTRRPFSAFFPCTPGLWSGFPGHLLGSPSLPPALSVPSPFYPTSPLCGLYFVFTHFPFCSFRPVPAPSRSAASLLIPSLPVFQIPFPSRSGPRALFSYPFAVSHRLSPKPCGLGAQQVLHGQS